MGDMKDPKRLFGRDTSVFENRILHAAQNDTIPHAMKILMSRGLNLGPPAMSVPAAGLVSVKTAAIALLGCAAIASPGVIGLWGSRGGCACTGIRAIRAHASARAVSLPSRSTG